MIVKRPQTKVKYFVLVFLTKGFMPTPIQSPTIDSKFMYNDLTLIGAMYKNAADTKYNEEAMPYMYCACTLPLVECQG